MFRTSIIRLIFLILPMLMVNLSHADTVVRLNIQQGVDEDTVDLRLYDTDKPVTVSNYMSYMLSGSYDNSFIHRSVPGFVIQGGGYNYDPNNSDFLTSFSAIPEQPAISNELGLSNLRGTIAMATLGDPDSATSQWFINLVDNSSSLDSGYTVFGEVLNDGMQTIDTIANHPIDGRTDIDTAFGQLPLIDYISDPIQTDNLVQIKQMTELFTITSDINYGIVTSGSSVQPEITIRNTGGDAILIGGISDNNPVLPPFNVVDVGCANSVIQPGDQCSFMVLFSPESEGVYEDSFNIEIISLGISYEVSLYGVGGLAVNEPDINVSFSSVNFGNVDVLESADLPYIFPPTGSLIPVILIENKGTQDLDISSITVIGQDAAVVNVDGDDACAVTIQPGQSCGIIIEFKPLTPGVKDATVSIVSNDPDEALFNIQIRGTAAGEDDGVLAEIEDLGPNNGDGNNDDILDSRQSNVATLIDAYGNYVTYLTDSGYNFRNMTALQSTDMVEMPADVKIGSGVFDFIVEGVAPGQLLEVGIILPAGLIPSAYYMYGGTADNPTQHWFDFDYDGETGAVIIGNAVFATSSGTEFTGSVLELIIRDGGRGDADMTVNGKISVIGGMPIKPKSSSDSGSIDLLRILCLTFTLILARSFIRKR
ncbi:MAG: peptidylprolyl isomerase [Gammaproteobacteria bacterium]|nr:peptidylprolyl isomerase [Gammaproteobacteria bacterium]